MKYTLGFIGCGNMGGALVRAAAKSVNATKIAVCDHNQEKTARLSKETGVIESTAKEIAKYAKFIVLGVKPQVMETAISEIKEILQNRADAVLVTMAAGLSIGAIRAYAGTPFPTIRIMPNTPVTLGAGMVLFACDGVSTEDEHTFLDAFSKAGILDKIPENVIDAGSALSGCGPAFVYAFAKALAKGGEECGVPKDKAELYAAQTILGAAEMLLTYKDPDTLIRNVCSPKGTTLEGMKALEENDLSGVVVSAVKAAYKRTLELKK